MPSNRLILLELALGGARGLLMLASQAQLVDSWLVVALALENYYRAA